MFILCKFFGNIGEKYAEKYLKSCGYTIIARQYHAKFVEIDILAKRGNTLYVFEVKSVSHRNNSHAPFHPIHRVSRRKIKKMNMFADYYLNRHQEYVTASVGVVIVFLAEELSYPEIEIIWL